MHRPFAGFTMVEVLVAVLLLAVGLVGALAMQAHAMRTRQESSLQTEALQDAATLYRAVDHGLRTYSGHAEGRLPQSPAHLDALTNLVRRWTPEHLHHRPLPDELAHIQSATRAYFRRLFG